MNFEKFCKRHQEHVERTGKYTFYRCPKCGVLYSDSIPCEYDYSTACMGRAIDREPVNAAMYRNCWLDIGEEISHAVNNIDLALSKGISDLEKSNLLSVRSALEGIGERCLFWVETTFQTDEIPVKRVVSENEMR